MEQAKVGKFIAECRKNKNMTQAELAEKLNITGSSHFLIKISLF